jgi:hypothetical protein
MASLNDQTAWVGNIDDLIALSIRESGRPLVDLTRDDDEVGPSVTVKSLTSASTRTSTYTSTMPALSTAAAASLILF